MQVVIVANESQKKELSSINIQEEGLLVWVNSIEQLVQYTSADVYIDLLFENTQKRVSLLAQLLPRLIVINSVTHTLKETNASFIRINGWPTFLAGDIVEASCLEEACKAKAVETFSAFGKKIEWLQDLTGFVTPRVISMIINEAYFALAEEVSTAFEIDTAMKLGTAYPYGPLEWGAKIGLQNVLTLLQKLSRQQTRYTPCDLLVKEANKTI